MKFTRGALKEIAALRLRGASGSNLGERSDTHWEFETEFERVTIARLMQLCRQFGILCGAAERITANRGDPTPSLELLEPVAAALLNDFPNWLGPELCDEIRARKDAIPRPPLRRP